ncbi:hypothetical protein PoB_007361800 [Plakobranchus ocellatus]|uniref:Uncharacterized protein n=1 Tax=Plakobranchus ocellatus TaxID=259542 RepID=A0AAV4DS12_9GAST|nr:hypothetical protein PoB_007361800 [Plakobranchus ocellatus]
MHKAISQQVSHYEETLATVMKRKLHLYGHVTRGSRRPKAARQDVAHVKSADGRQSEEVVEKPLFTVDRENLDKIQTLSLDFKGGNSLCSNQCSSATSSLG